MPADPRSVLAGASAWASAVDPATDLENHYLPTRGKAGPSILTSFAQEQKSQVLCYANANLTREDQPGEVLQFVEFWRDLTDRNPQWLFFDSRLTTYAELARLTEQQIWFVTIRRRGIGLLRRLAALPESVWQKAVISNNFTITPRQLITDYARRNGVEDALGSSVDFFHLDCLASEVRLNVDPDTVLTVLAHGCYRWLANQLHGFSQVKPKGVYRTFVETSGIVAIERGRRIVVSFDRRAHNPILREAQLDKDCPPIPWLANHRLGSVYT